jgi:hypothetical protein
MTAWEYGLAALTSAVVFAFLLRTVHQLGVVTRIHAEFVTIDIFKLDPLYSFANLTAWTGIAILATMVFGIASLAAVSTFSFGLVDSAIFALFVCLAIGSFVIPLLGLHGRIQHEKDHQKALAGETLKTAVAEVETRIRAGDYEAMTDVNNGLVAATSAVTTISRISTWPWRQDTIRGFVGALGLPVFVYAVTAILSRFLQ